MKLKIHEYYSLKNMKMSKSLKPLLLFIISVISAFTLQTCKPDDEVGKTFGPYTLGEGKDYLNFKSGSWWVYQHNKSGLYDTLILKNILISTRRFEGKNILIKDVVIFSIYSTTTKYMYDYYTLTPNPDAIPEILARVNSIDILHGKSKPGDYHGETISFFYPFDSLRESSLGVGVTTYLGMDTLVNMKGNKFKNVRKFQQTKDACWDGNTCKYYWAKDIGLIKKENIKKEESWELINWHVEIP